MVNRKISLDKYVLAAIISFLIFAVGFSSGFLIEKQRLDYTNSVLAKEKVDSNSLQVQYLYLNYLQSNKNCGALEEIFRANLVSLDDSMKRLLDYSKNSLIDRESFDLTYRDYVLEELKYWLLSDNVKKSCNDDFVTALYFFTENCDACDKQGYVLDYLKGLFKDKLLVFSFNVDLKDQEPMIKALVANYNLTNYPSVVISNQTINNFADSDVLTKEICNNFKEKPAECH